MYFVNEGFDGQYDNIIDLDVLIHETDPNVLIKKEVGDIVTIIDYSTVSDEYGNEIDDKLINSSDEFIVIENNQNYKFKSIVTYIQDLLLYNRRTYVKYRCSCKYTRII